MFSHLDTRLAHSLLAVYNMYYYSKQQKAGRGLGINKQYYLHRNVYYTLLLQLWLVKEYLALHTACANYQVVMSKLACENVATVSLANSYLLKVRITEGLF